MTAPVIEEIQTPSPLKERFLALGINATTYAHAPVFTVNDGPDVKKALKGGQTKNLFLRDKRGGFWLVTALASTVIDLRNLSDRLGCARFSFAPPDLLLEVLGVTPGSVTPFSLINDTKNCVQVIFDQAMMGLDTLNFHPLRNNMTTAISPAGLLSFAASCGHRPQILDFTQAAQGGRHHGT